MMFFYRVLVLFLVPFGVFGKGLNLIIQSDRDFNLEVVLSGKKGLNFGALRSDEKRVVTVNVINKTESDLSFDNWRSPCDCLSFDKTVDMIKSHEQVSLKATLNGAGYSGRFSKFMYIGFSSSDERNGSCFLGIHFNVSDEKGAGKVEKDVQKLSKGGLRYTDFDELIKGDYQLLGTERKIAWIFAGKDCPTCNYLKRHYLPDIVKDGDIMIVTVNLDKKDNFLVLLKLETLLGIKKKNKTPVLYWNGFLYYGSDAIKRVVATQGGVKKGEDLLRENLVKCKGDIGKFISDDEEETLLKERTKAVTLLTIIIGGLTDGLNPCVFATLIFFMSALGVAKISGRTILVVGSVYCFACFLTYTLLGLGVFRVMKALSAYHVIQEVFNWGMVVALVVLGLLTFRDGWRFYKNGNVDDVSLQLPTRLKKTIHNVMRKGLRTRFLIWGSFGIGVFVTLIESVCTGQVYLPVLSMLVKNGGEGSFFYLGYLLLYNVMFIIPLVVIFVVYYRGTTMSRLLNWSKQNVVYGKVLMGVFFLLLAVALTILVMR